MIDLNIQNHSDIDRDKISTQKNSNSTQDKNSEDEIDEIPQGIYNISTIISSNRYTNYILLELNSIRESDTQLSKIAKRKRVQNQEKAIIFEKIASIIRFFQDRYPYYYINDISDNNHLLYNYRQVESQRFKTLYIEYRNNFRKFKTIQNLLTYTRYLLPPSLYKHWIQRPQNTKWTITNEDCSYPNVILSIFVIKVYFEEESSIFEYKYSQKLTRLDLSQDHKLKEITYLSECYD